mgnify:CR=1 FL=1
MATLTDLHNDVRANIGEAVSSFWDDAEIDRYLTNAIRTVQGEVPNDALRSMLRYYDFDLPDEYADQPHVQIPDSLRILMVMIEESDGEFGYPFSDVAINTLQSARRYEDGQDVNGTETRMFSRGFWMNTQDYAGAEIPERIGLYPKYFADGRVIRFFYIKKAEETGNLDLPFRDPNLQELVTFKATAMALLKKGRDIQGSQIFMNLYETGMAKIERDYPNKYGLTPAQIGNTLPY